jgi:hypothetical protein
MARRSRVQGQLFYQVYDFRDLLRQFHDKSLKLLSAQSGDDLGYGRTLGYVIPVMYEAKQSGHDVLAIPAPIVGAGTDGVGRLVAFQGNANAVRGVLAALHLGKKLVASLRYPEDSVPDRVFVAPFKGRFGAILPDGFLGQLEAAHQPTSKLN